jgi:hypothetical protein
MRMSQKWILAFVVAFLGCAGALPAVGQECARLTDGHRSLVPRPDSAPHGPVCREPSAVSPAEFKLPAEEEPVPSESVCNCDSDSDCKAICGDRGGSCQALLACPVPPYKHKGTCACNH